MFTTATDRALLRLNATARRRLHLHRGHRGRLCAAFKPRRLPGNVGRRRHNVRRVAVRAVLCWFGGLLLAQRG